MNNFVRFLELRNIHKFESAKSQTFTIDFDVYYKHRDMTTANNIYYKKKRLIMIIKRFQCRFNENLTS
jgi:hypothetical protein